MPNNLRAFTPEVWSTKLIERIDQVNIALNFANTDYEDEIRQAGDTVQVRTVGDVVMGTYTRGMPIAVQSLAPVKEALTVDTARYFAFDVDKLDVVANDVSTVDVYTRRAGVAVSNDVDAFIFAAYDKADARNVITGSAGAAIDVSPSDDATGVYRLIVKAGRKLDDLNVDRRARWIVVSPYVYELMCLDTKWFIRASALGDQVVTTARFDNMTTANTPGFVGRVSNFDVYVSNNLPADPDGTHYLPYGQGKPISYAAAIPPGYIERMPLENTFEDRVKGLLLHGKAVFGEDAKRLGYIKVDNA